MTQADASAVAAEAAAAAGIPVVGGDEELDVDAVRLAARCESVVGIRFIRGLPLVAFGSIPSPADVAEVEHQIGSTVVPALANSEDSYRELQRRAAELVADRQNAPQIERILDFAIQERASDTHLTVGMPPWLRIAGEVAPLDGWPVITADDIEAMARWVVPDFTLDGFTGDRDTASAYGPVRFRVNMMRQRDQLSMVLRTIPLKVPEFKSLGVPPQVLKFGDLPQGLVLVCGVTGSGKSTTLASLVHHINLTRRAHIVTIEDPIEFVHTSVKSLIRQREIERDTESFGTALRAVLRQDPDVIQIGEMRDPESIRAALTAAETGHLVFSTIHAQDSASVVNRIIDVFPGDEQNQIRTQLAASLKGVVCQSLMRGERPGTRIPICEVMVGTTAISANIRDGHTEQITGVVETSRKDGMQSFDWALANAVRGGLLAREDAFLAAHKQDSFTRYVESAA